MGSELLDNTIMGAAAAFLISCGVAACCRLRLRMRQPPAGTPLPPQPTAPPAPILYHPHAPGRYVVYMPPYQQQQPYPPVQPYPPIQPYPPVQPYPPHQPYP
jgi:hypothetical protein